MKVIFMGTPDFAVAPLKSIAASGHDIGYVITQPDKAKNRGKKIEETPVKKAANELMIPVLQPEKIRGNERVMEALKAYNPDIIVVAAYGQIIPKEILELPYHGCINIHASLLPRFRGASPIQHAILAGDEKTGITIMQMAEGLDTGDMLFKGEVEIGKMNFEELHDALAKLGADMIVDALKKIEIGEVNPEKQDDSKSCYASMISKKDGKIDFTQGADVIERKIRAFDPWPSAFCMWGDKNVKIKKAEAIISDVKATETEFGKVLSATDEGIDVACGSGILRIKVLQMPGKRPMAVGDFLRGNKLEKGEILE